MTVDPKPTTTGLDCVVLGRLFAGEEVRRVFDSRGVVQGWLDAERALALAEADVGVVPRAAAERIADEARVEHFDLERLGADVLATAHPLVPLVRELAERCGEDAGGFVHWGATTQDIVDTGLVLQVRVALGLVRRDLVRAHAAGAALANEYRDAPMAGRTHGQHAVPITFGLKAATWTDELGRCLGRLDAAERAACTAQLAGAAGTLAALGDDAAAVREAFCRRLDLAEAEVPWHTARDRLRDLGHALAEIAAAAERIAAEVARLQATETAELAEPYGPASVGSSTMPQKRNPMACEYVVAGARLLRGAVSVVAHAPAHAGERDMALWAVEWVAIPQALILASGIASKLAGILEGLSVDTGRMRRNVELTRGAIMAEAAMMELAPVIGHEPAHALVSAVSKRAAELGTTLVDALKEDPAARAHLSDGALERLARPDTYLGTAAAAAATVVGEGD